MTTIGPVSTKEREVFLDVLRGIAVLGIFIANIEWFSFYSPSLLQGKFIFPGIDSKVYFLQAMLIEGKFYSIFSVLFGWGLALQMSRSRLDDATTASIMRRRLYFMLLLGGIHLLFIWQGDIVFFYGLLGFILLALRKFSNKTLLVTGIVLILSPILLYYLKMKFLWLNAPVEMLYKFGDYLYHLNGLPNADAEAGAYKHSNSILRDILINISDSPGRYGYLLFVSRVPKVLGAMLIGFVIGRSGIYKLVPQHKKLLAILAIAVAVFSLPFNYLLAIFMGNSVPYYSLKIEGWYQTIDYALGVFPLAMVYVVVLALALQQKTISKLLSFVAPVGKMAFSNYMLESLIGIFTFYGVGFGMLQQAGPFAWTIFAVLVFIVQIIGSTIWLRYFQFGPVEWIWRSLTYGKRQPFRKGTN